MERRIEVRDVIDWPEKGAMGLGIILIVVSPVFPPAAVVGGELVVGGAVSLGITRAILPRKQ